MIKCITAIRQTSTPAVCDKLESFFSALGFERGKDWDEEQSRGRAFLAPLGNLEFIDGVLPSNADVFVEVTSQNSVQQIAHHRLTQSWGKYEATKPIPAPADTAWKSRRCTVEPVPAV